MRTLLLCVILILTNITITPAQDSLLAPGNVMNNNTSEIFNPPPETIISTPGLVSRSPFEETMILSVLIFALLILFMEFLLIAMKKLDSEQGIRVFGVTIIITSGLFLIAAGYTSEQISPIVGLLGTIAGYLLGNTQSIKTKKNND